jgi:hypothetical protein
VLLIEEPVRTLVMQNTFVLRAIHFSIGHFPFVRIFFVLKAASSRTPAIFVFLTLVIAINDQLQH